MIHFSSEALLDIERIRKFLDDKNPDAAVRAVGTIWAALQKVECFPKIGKPVQGSRIRQIVVPFGQRGYIARYRIRPNDVIYVTRIWHSREGRR
jgi:toxin ParE1/3/4